MNFMQRKILLINIKKAEKDLELLQDLDEVIDTIQDVKKLQSMLKQSLLGQKKLIQQSVKAGRKELVKR